MYLLFFKTLVTCDSRVIVVVFLTIFSGLASKQLAVRSLNVSLY